MKDDGVKSVIIACTIVFFIATTVLITACKPETVIEKKVEEVIAPVKEEVEEVEDKIDDIIPNIKEEIDTKIDELSFGAAWRMMYNKLGEGHVFDWNGNCYTTNMKEQGEMSWQQ